MLGGFGSTVVHHHTIVQGQLVGIYPGLILAVKLVQEYSQPANWLLQPASQPVLSRPAVH